MSWRATENRNIFIYHITFHQGIKNYQNRWKNLKNRISPGHLNACEKKSRESDRERKREGERESEKVKSICEQKIPQKIVSITNCENLSFKKRHAILAWVHEIINVEYYKLCAHMRTPLEFFSLHIFFILNVFAVFSCLVCPFVWRFLCRFTCSLVVVVVVVVVAVVVVFSLVLWFFSY